MYFQQHWKQIMSIWLSGRGEVSRQRICRSLIGSSTASGETERAIADLKTDFAELFSCLQITVSTLQRWTTQDVRNNLAGGELWGPDVVDHPGVSEIEESLAECRTFIVSMSVTYSAFLC
jgi:hypothetical protein